MDEREKKQIRIWEIAGILLIAAFGQRWHYLFDTWPDAWTGAISPINESIWEHLKLYLVPTLTFAAVEYLFIRKSARNFLLAKAASLYCMVLVMVVVFTTTYLIIGHDILAISIAIYLVSIALGQWVGYRILTGRPLGKIAAAIGAFAIMLLAGLMVGFTFAPPHIPLFFADPASGLYGIQLK